KKTRWEPGPPQRRLRQIPGCCGRRAAPQNATAGPACGRPDRPTPGCLRPAYATDSTPNAPKHYATRSSAPTTRHLVNVSRISLLASRQRSGWPRRHAGGRRPATAARRACRRLVILEVRRVLELVLGPADFELDHGGVVIAAGHGGIATRAGTAAAGVGGNRLECAHIDGDTFFADAEESAHTHDQPEDLAVLVEQHVTHIANVCVVGAEHIGPFELGEDPLVRALRRDEFRGVMRGGRGGIVSRRRRFWRHIGLREGA